ncbi:MULTISPECIES: MarR family transcriptional regulator [Actinoplanes]|uniref:MarR family winged helix-turn-helix transcriptional regulator n=1 Tax=Actinoplanes TaxID=1865 RepID=UPI000696F4A5|nr:MULTISPECIES: MarR family transcriptional regulator [Actinoplanes]GLX99971.1 MarR family transcriptional regulator [Actinoplanes sp. NBRC 101535]
MSDDDQTAVDLMLLAHQLHRSLDRRAQVDFAHPKPPELHLVALWHVHENPGCTVRQLADALQLKPNNASALVTAMVNDGMLRREPDADDRRVVRLHTTPQAAGRMTQVQALFTGYVLDAMARLDARQRTAIRAALPALTELSRLLRDGGH